MTVLYPLIRITTIYHELWVHPTDRFHHHSPLAELPRPSPIPLRQMNHNDSLAFRIIKQYAVFAPTITLSFRLPFSVWYYLSGRLNFVIGVEFMCDRVGRTAYKEYPPPP